MSFEVVVLHCSLFFEWNKIVRVRVQVQYWRIDMNDLVLVKQLLTIWQIDSIKTAIKPQQTKTKHEDNSTTSQSASVKTKFIPSMNSE